MAGLGLTWEGRDSSAPDACDVLLFTLDQRRCAPGIAVSRDGRTARLIANNGRCAVFGSVGFAQGVYYWEVKGQQAEPGCVFIGVSEASPRGGGSERAAAAVARMALARQGLSTAARRTERAAPAVLFPVIGMRKPGDSVMLMNRWLGWPGAHAAPAAVDDAAATAELLRTWDLPTQAAPPAATTPPSALPLRRWLLREAWQESACLRATACARALKSPEPLLTFGAHARRRANELRGGGSGEAAGEAAGDSASGAACVELVSGAAGTPAWAFNVPLGALLWSAGARLEVAYSGGTVVHDSAEGGGQRAVAAQHEQRVVRLRVTCAGVEGWISERINGEGEEPIVRRLPPQQQAEGEPPRPTAAADADGSVVAPVAAWEQRVRAAGGADAKRWQRCGSAAGGGDDDYAKGEGLMTQEAFAALAAEADIHVAEALNTLGDALGEEQANLPWLAVKAAVTATSAGAAAAGKRAGLDEALLHATEDWWQHGSGEGVNDYGGQRRAVSIRARSHVRTFWARRNSFRIQGGARNCSDAYLPHAQTCAFSLSLPAHTSCGALRE
ncbi:hypothetical protein JKP88DRAFT_299062 [Tribonema minus]|uniref:Uncharacterized protein n=1 Tax=Tribonema minus TaxID=303371 RepID=A0A836CM38_9STRA|nr:hypothetical protein JKP88DRAFT_299062 [Tribonema minus]